MNSVKNQLYILPLFSITVISFLLSNCSKKNEHSGRYPFKSGKIIYQNTVQKTTINQTLYFKEYGNTETIVSKLVLNNEVTLLTSIFKGNACYTFADKEEKTNKTAIDRNKLDHLGLFTITSKMLKDANAIYSGSETILKKNCEVYSIKNDEYDLKVSVWKNVIMRLISNYRGTKMDRVIIQFEETEDFPIGVFETPN